MLTTLLRIDVRRPRVWIAITTAVLVAWRLGVGATGSGPAPAIASGGLLAVAAIGRLPTGMPVARVLWAQVAACRVCWVVAGFLAGGAVAAFGRGPTTLLLPGAAVLAATGTATAQALAVGLGRTQPVAAGHALAMAGSAAGAAVVVAAAGGGAALAALAAFAAWCLSAAGTLVDTPGGARDWIGSPAVAARHRSAEPGQGIAMATTLAAMAGCFFLAPQLSWCYAAVVVAWFSCLAVPAATEFTLATPGRWLVAAAAGRPDLPGSFRRVVRLTAIALGILGWPAVVASVLPSAEAGGAAGPLEALGWLAVVALLLVVTAAVALQTGRGETARAAVLAVTALAATNWPRAADFPSLPAWWPQAARISATSGVEPRTASCKTPLPTPSASPSQPAPRWVQKEPAGAR